MIGELRQLFLSYKNNKRLIHLRFNEVLIAIATIVESVEFFQGNFIAALWAYFAFVTLLYFYRMNLKGVIFHPIIGLAFMLVWFTEGRFYTRPQMLEEESVSPDLERSWKEAPGIANHD